MSQLIHMKHRIRAVGVTKKLTHAMRVIAMAMHGRVKDRRVFMERYRNGVQNLFADLRAQYPAWKDPLFDPNRASTADVLIVFVGSQKGLCGAFNLNALQFLIHVITKYQATNARIRLITVGKKAADLVRTFYASLLYQRYEPFTTTTFVTVAQQIVADVITNNYSEVVLVSNYPVSFFSQKQRSTTVIPLTMSGERNYGALGVHREYVIEQPSDKVLTALVHRYLTAQIEQVFLDSLTAEHAARFVAMDASTRNAAKLLDEMNLQYNKLRQGKITKELAELAGGFLP